MKYLGFGYIMHILGLKYIEINRYKYIMNRLIFILCMTFEYYKIRFIVYLLNIKIYKKVIIILLCYDDSHKYSLIIFNIAYNTIHIVDTKNLYQ